MKWADVVDGRDVNGVPFAQHPGGFWLVAVLVTGIVWAGTALAWTHRDRR